MEKAIIVGGSGVEGNIGSCAVVSETYPISVLRVETVAVNSCTGDVVAQNSYIDFSGILLGAIIAAIIVVAVRAAWMVQD